MTKGACAAIVCWPRSKRCRIPTKEKKRKSSIDLDRGAACRARNLRQTRDDSPRDAVETLRTRALFSQRRHRLAGVPADSNARIDFHFAQHRHTISDRRLRAFA